MRFVLCDEDQFLRDMVESIVVAQGHEVVGTSDATAPASRLVEHARPDVVILDLALGYNTDFDVIATACDVGATVVIFSFTADESALARYPTRPIVVAKPDLTTLEHTIQRIVAARDATSTGAGDRRSRPSRSAVGPTPSGLGDAHAFYEAVNNAVEGDALLSVELEADGVPIADGDVVGTQTAAVVRETDRVLAISSSVKVFLAGAGDVGLTSFLTRLRVAVPLSHDVRIRSVVLRAGETGTDAFDRLKHGGLEHTA